MRRNLHAGEGKLGCIFWILIAVFLFMIGSRVIPTKMAVMQLEDFMEELAMTQPRKSGDFLEREIYNRAKQLDLDIPRKNIQVKKHTNRVIMEVNFSVPIEIIGFTYNWNVELFLDRNIFLI